MAARCYERSREPLRNDPDATDPAITNSNSSYQIGLLEVVRGLPIDRLTGSSVRGYRFWSLLLTIWLCPSQGMLKCVLPVGISRSSEAGAISSLPVLACVQLR